jgi:hypothetical protein
MEEKVPQFFCVCFHEKGLPVGDGGGVKWLTQPAGEVYVENTKVWTGNDGAWGALSELQQ